MKQYKINQRVYIHQDGYGKVDAFIPHSGLHRILFDTGKFSFYSLEDLDKKNGAPPPKFIKAFEGQEVNIKSYQQSLKNWPSNLRACIDDYGNAFIVNATHKTYKCGCEIVGCGTLQFPLSIKPCKKHKSIK